MSCTPPYKEKAAQTGLGHFPLFKLFLIALLLAPTIAAQAGPEQVVSAIMDAWNKNDLPAYASTFTEDGTFVNVNGRLRMGQPQGAGTGLHSAMFQNTHVEIKPESVRLLRPDVAIVHAHWALTGDVRDPQPREYLETMVVVKRGDRWLIAAGHNGSAVDRSAMAGTDRVLFNPTPALTSTDRTLADMQKLLAEADSAWTRSNATALANLFAEDADLVNSTAHRFHGRPRIEEYLKEKLSQSFQGTTSTTRILTYKSLGPDLAVIEARWELRVNPTQNDPPKTMTSLRVAVYDNGRWKIAAAQDTVTAPFPPQNP